ncbi:MAG: glycosyltransferase family 4 protein [Hyphomicrobiaceae bacterium]
MPIPEPLAPRVAISWNGLPQYAAREIRVAIDRIGRDCIVVGSKPAVPVEGMERVLGCPVHWVAADKPVTWASLGHAVPGIFVQSGWSYPAFSALGAEVKAKGGRVIGLSDANWRGNFRQVVLGPVAFRVRHKSYFDAMIVPGAQGARLMAWFGMPKAKVHTGMYGADPSLFRGGPPLAERPKTFLFVGQFIARKDVLGLARAFVRFSASHPEWSLRICGGGAQKALIPAHPKITVEDFVQPEQLAQRFFEARFFVLPSLVEAWGLVVHEAASAGCGLVLSDAIGSADDLSTTANAVRFKAGNEDDLLRALHDAAAFDSARLAAAEAVSRGLAADFGPERFGREVAGLVEHFTRELRGKQGA